MAYGLKMGSSVRMTRTHFCIARVRAVRCTISFGRGANLGHTDTELFSISTLITIYGDHFK